MEAKITVDGLAEAIQGLRNIRKDAPKRLADAQSGAAVLLVTKTRPQVPRRTGAAAGSLRATGAKVTAGGGRVTYFAWLDFGGAAGRNHSVVRPYRKEGRYLYPTLRKTGPEIERKQSETLTALIRGAGLDAS